MSDLTVAFNAIVKALGVWFIFWAIRRKGEFDHKLDTKSQIVRWAIVVLAFVLMAEFSNQGLTAPRILALVIGLAFLCWPNFAYYLTNPFGKISRRD